MTGWAEFVEELDRWRDQRRAATFWWRDDDAVTATPALARLMALQQEYVVPVAIAVIPALADETLGGPIADGDNCVLQHGYAHRNHATGSSGKIELGGERPPGEVAEELLLGREKLTDLLGARVLPIMVPPWNRIDDSIAALLPGLGYAGLSAFAPRQDRDADGLVTVNTHVDIIDWRETRAFCGEHAALNAAIGHLSARRAGGADPLEPTGLLTHHLAHDGDCWAFIDRFLAETSAHPGARWVSAPQAFGVAA